MLLARRKTGGGCVYQDLGNSVFSFINPVGDFAKEDYKTMNNEVLLKSLEAFGIKGEASGRNDLVVDDKKVSGSAYKLKLGRKDGSGRRSLHHGTMLLDLELGALGKYLNPNKKKLESKGVTSVISRVMNLKEMNKDIDHASFCNSLQQAFEDKWAPQPVNSTILTEDDLKKIPQLMQIYNQVNEWDWRFGETPQFTNSIEHKFDWALVDVQFDVEKGKIVKGQVFSDCLIPVFIDALNEEFATGNVSYDVDGIKTLCSKLNEKFTGEESMKAVVDVYIPEFEKWLSANI